MLRYMSWVQILVKGRTDMSGGVGLDLVLCRRSEFVTYHSGMATACLSRAANPAIELRCCAGAGLTGAKDRRRNLEFNSISGRCI